jgi:hypothetical protein
MPPCSSRRSDMRMVWSGLWLWIAWVAAVPEAYAQPHGPERQSDCQHRDQHWSLRCMASAMPASHFRRVPRRDLDVAPRAPHTPAVPAVDPNPGLDAPAELRPLAALCRRAAEFRRLSQNINQRFSADALWEYHLVFREILEHLVRAPMCGVDLPDPC